MLPRDMNPGDPILADWLNQVKREVLQSIRGDGQIVVNRAGQDLTIGLGGRQPGIQGFVAEITEESSDGGAYSWNRLVFDQVDRLQDTDPLVSGVENAVEVHSLNGVLPGTRVLMRFLGRDASGEPRYVFQAIGYGVLMPFLLTQTGGAEGSKTTATTWTYTVSTIGGIQLATDVDPTASPHRYRRMAIGKYLAATGATAYWQDNDGTPELIIDSTNEVLDAGACSEGSS